MRHASLTTKATDTNSEYVIFIAVHSNNGYANASQYCITSIFSCLIPHCSHTRTHWFFVTYCNSCHFVNINTDINSQVSTR